MIQQNILSELNGEQPLPSNSNLNLQDFNADNFESLGLTKDFTVNLEEEEDEDEDHDDEGEQTMEDHDEGEEDDDENMDEEDTDDEDLDENEVDEEDEEGEIDFTIDAVTELSHTYPENYYKTLRELCTDAGMRLEEH